MRPVKCTISVASETAVTVVLGNTADGEVFDRPFLIAWEQCHRLGTICIKQTTISPGGS